MKRRLITGLVVAVVGGFLVACFASPFVAAQGLIRAARAGDEAGLERHVDFPAFRASLKDELNARMVGEVRDRADGDRGLAALGMLLAPSLVSGVVETFVTPQAVAAMVRTADAPEPESPEPPADAPAVDKDRIHQAWAYRDMNTFAVTLTRDDRPEDPLVLLMQRRGPFQWKLAGIDLTPDPMG